MVRTKFYLDTRKAAVTNETNPLRINICKNRKTAALPLGIYLASDQWDAKAEKVVKPPKKCSTTMQSLEKRLRLTQ